MAFKLFDSNNKLKKELIEREAIEIELKKTRQELAIAKQTADEAAEFSRCIINTVHEPLLFLDQDLRIIAVSRSFYEVFKLTPEETIGQLIYDLGNKQWDISGLSELLEYIIPHETIVDNYEIEHNFAAIGKRIMLLNARQIQQEPGKQRTIILAIDDITERKGAANKIKSLVIEKDIILKEVHHRIKNSMNTINSLLSLQADILEDPVAIEALKDTESRVLSMMVLYDKLYRSIDYSEISIKEYLNTLIDEIISNFSQNKFIKIEKNISDFIIDAKRLQSIGIIINELLTNIVKYAFAGRSEGLVKVVTILKDTAVSIIIHDNGVGIIDTINFENSSGFGLMLVKSLAEQIDGTIKLEQDNGTKFTLEFKL